MTYKSLLKLFATLIAGLFISTLFTSCDTTQTTGGNFSLSFGPGTSLPKTTDDALELTDVKILLRDIKLEQESASKTTDGDHEGEGDEVVVKVGPFVVNLNLDAITTDVAISDIPVGTYNEIKFKIHTLEASETPPDPEFIDGQDPSKRYSVIVRGTYNSVPFIYKSSKPAHQKIRLEEPIEVVEGTPTNLTITVDPYTWFYKGDTFLDPTNSTNINDIDNNIAHSFRSAFRDNNHDCHGD
ncbi:hypothetical protein LJE86_15760 [bacterium BMS3Abin03]|jgi:hypothetical protein|nr:hypothetical protein [bacterium BMS3Abin03]